MQFIGKWVIIIIIIIVFVLVIIIIIIVIVIIIIFIIIFITIIIITIIIITNNIWALFLSRGTTNQIARIIWNHCGLYWTSNLMAWQNSGYRTHVWIDDYNHPKFDPPWVETCNRHSLTLVLHQLRCVTWLPHKGKGSKKNSKWREMTAQRCDQRNISDSRIFFLWF